MVRENLDSTIGDVSDTALWVAVYRAEETERPDALFRDPLAARLAGERGKRIASRMSDSKYVGWSLVTRTVLIDEYIRMLLAEGVDTVVNLGAGLDTRPYRLDLPPTLRWIEADFPHMIEHKNKLLKDEKPRCRLERIAVDLTDAQARRQLLKDIAAESRRVLILTEGVVLYLSNQQAAELAADLHAHASFKYWIVDYFAPQFTRFMRKRRGKQMQNAPVQFDPEDWHAFFKQQGWSAREIRYLMEESEKHGRGFPQPWWVSLIYLVAPKMRLKNPFRKAMGYVILTPESGSS